VDGVSRGSEAASPFHAQFALKRLKMDIKQVASRLGEVVLLRGSSRKRRFLFTISAIAGIYLFSFPILMRSFNGTRSVVHTPVPVTSTGQVPYWIYFSKSPSWNKFGKRFYWPLLKPLEGLSIIEYMDDASALQLDDPRLINVWLSRLTD
jgi:hypothetical protein